jgi:hypothetical protein
MTLELWLGSALCVAALLYMTFAMLRPEKF